MRMKPENYMRLSTFHIQKADIALRRTAKTLNESANAGQRKKHPPKLMLFP